MCNIFVNIRKKLEITEFEFFEQQFIDSRCFERNLCIFYCLAGLEETFYFAWNLAMEAVYLFETSGMEPRHSV